MGSASHFDVATFVFSEALDAGKVQGQAGRAELGRASLCDDVALDIVSVVVASATQVQARQAEVGRASLCDDSAVFLHSAMVSPLNASEIQVQAGQTEVGRASHFDVAAFDFSEALDAGKVQGQAGRAEVGRASLCVDVASDSVSVVVASTTHQVQAGHAEVGRASLRDDSAVYNGSAFVPALNASKIQGQAGRAEVGRASLCDDAALDIGFANAPALKASGIQVQAGQAEVGSASPFDDATFVFSEALDAGKVQGQAGLAPAAPATGADAQLHCAPVGVHSFAERSGEKGHEGTSGQPTGAFEAVQAALGSGVDARGSLAVDGSQSSAGGSVAASASARSHRRRGRHKRQGGIDGQAAVLEEQDGWLCHGCRRDRLRQIRADICAQQMECDEVLALTADHKVARGFRQRLARALATLDGQLLEFEGVGALLCECCSQETAAGSGNCVP